MTCTWLPTASHRVGQVGQPLEEEWHRMGGMPGGWLGDGRDDPSEQPLHQGSRCAEHLQPQQCFVAIKVASGHRHTFRLKRPSPVAPGSGYLFCLARPCGSRSTTTLGQGADSTPPTIGAFVGLPTKTRRPMVAEQPNPVAPGRNLPDPNRRSGAQNQPRPPGAPSQRQQGRHTFRLGGGGQRRWGG